MFELVFSESPCGIAVCRLGFAGECEDRPGRSADKRHTSGVLLMGFENLFIDSSSGLEFHQSSSLREMEKAWLTAMVVGSSEDRWVLLAWISM